jgi:hypothetical protein
LCAHSFYNLPQSAAYGVFSEGQGDDGDGKEEPRQPKLTGFGLTQAQQHDDGLLRLAVSRGCLTQAIAPNRETTQAKHQPNPK